MELASVMETSATSANTKMITTTSGSLRTTRMVAIKLPNLSSFFSINSAFQDRTGAGFHGQLSSAGDIFPILVHSA